MIKKRVKTDNNAMKQRRYPSESVSFLKAEYCVTM